MFSVLASPLYYRRGRSQPRTALPITLRIALVGSCYIFCVLMRMYKHEQDRETSSHRIRFKGIFTRVGPTAGPCGEVCTNLVQILPWSKICTIWCFFLRVTRSGSDTCERSLRVRSHVADLQQIELCRISANKSTAHNLQQPVQIFASPLKSMGENLLRICKV